MSVHVEEVQVPEGQPKEKTGLNLGHPGVTTARLHSVAESVMTLGSNLNELTEALDNLVKVTEKVTGKSLK